MPVLVVYAILAVLRVVMPRVGSRVLNDAMVRLSLARSYMGWSRLAQEVASSWPDSVSEYRAGNTGRLLSN